MKALLFPYRRRVYRLRKSAWLFLLKLLEGRALTVNGPLNTRFQWIVDLNYPYRMADASYEPMLATALLKLLDPGDCFIDVGANCGYFSVMAKQRVKNGKVIAIEPLPANVATIRRQLAANNNMQIDIIEAAVDSSDGEIIFDITENNACGRIAGVKWEQSRVMVKQIRVKTVQLSRYIDANRPRVVKIDVEGHEAHILQSLDMDMVLRNKPTFIVELHGKDNFRSCFQVFERINYSMTALDGTTVSLDEPLQYIIARPS